MRILPLIALVCACELDKTAIPRTDPRLALHGVLSASASTQVVLLERTRAGLVQIVSPSFDLEDPIGSDEGIAETGAFMTLLAPDGTVYVATEDNSTPNGKGRGVYRFAIPGSALQRNGTYHLSVATSTGSGTRSSAGSPHGCGGSGSAVTCCR